MKWHGLQALYIIGHLTFRNWYRQSSCGRVFGHKGYLFRNVLHVLYDKRDSGVRSDKAEDLGGKVQEC